MCWNLHVESIIPGVLSSTAGPALVLLTGLIHLQDNVGLEAEPSGAAKLNGLGHRHLQLSAVQAGENSSSSSGSETSFDQICLPECWVYLQ